MRFASAPSFLHTDEHMHTLCHSQTHARTYLRTYASLRTRTYTGVPTRQYPQTRTHARTHVPANTANTHADPPAPTRLLWPRLETRAKGPFSHRSTSLVVDGLRPSRHQLRAGDGGGSEAIGDRGDHMLLRRLPLRLRLRLRLPA
eukprot:GHVU01098208.1.p1 GENE.GHVU01098208.1~~GHVU01098208.1.p1  ORF type:complete len:145 (-),score=3.98 GHVU01098208.1:59-493(-)